MGEEARDIIMSNIRRDILNNTLAGGARFDGRAFDEYRKMEVHRGVLGSADGSALAKIGDTQVLVSCKFDIVKPFSDRPREGVLVTNAELLPLASPLFEPGPPNENCIELARVVDRAVRSAECIDLQSLYVTEEKVLGVYLDIYVLNYAGNYTDAATLAATAALLNAKMPKIENNAIVRGQYTGPLNPRALPVSTTMIKVGGTWLLDPSREEERVMETVLTVATTENHVCAMQKGKGSVTKEEVLTAIDIAFKRGNDLRRMLKG